MKKSSGQVQIVEEKILSTSGNRGRSVGNNSKKTIREEVKKEVKKDVSKETPRSRKWKEKKVGNTPRKEAGGISLDTSFGRFGVDWMTPGQNMAIQKAVGKRVMPRWLMMPRMAGGEYADCICGTDAISVLRVPQTNYKVGDVIFQIKISPQLFPRTRLAALAPLWNRFRFKRLAFEYDNIADSTKSGQLLGFYDPDASRDWFSTADNFEIGSGLANSKPTQISQPQVWEVPNPNFSNMFTGQIGADVRLQEQGQFVIIATSDINYATVPTIGTLYIKYMVEFYSPQNNILHKPLFVSVDSGASPTPTTPFGVSPTATAGIYSDLVYDYTTSPNSKFTFDASGYVGGKLFIAFKANLNSGTFTGFSNSYNGMVVYDTTIMSNVSYAIWRAAATITGEDCFINFLITGTSLVLQNSNVWFSLVPPIAVAKPSKEQVELDELQLKFKKLEDRINSLSTSSGSDEHTHQYLEGVSQASCQSTSCSTCDKGKHSV